MCNLNIINVHDFDHFQCFEVKDCVNYMENGESENLYIKCRKTVVFQIFSDHVVSVIVYLFRRLCL